MNVRKWLKEHSLKLLAIRDTPNAVARRGDRDFLWLHPVGRPEDSAFDLFCMADAEQHHRGCHRRHAARRRAALHAGAFSLGISNRLLAPERPASMAGPAEGHSLECEH